MLTYRDRTFCINKECKKECNRRLTEQIEKEASEFGMYVAVANFNCEVDNDSN